MMKRFRKISSTYLPLQTDARVIVGLMLCATLAACGGSQSSSLPTPADEPRAEAGAIEQGRLLAVAESCEERHAVADEDLILVAEWAAAMADAYAVWAPEDSMRFSEAFVKLATCATNRGVEDRLSEQAEARLEGFELAFDEPDDSLGEDTKLLRAIGDANRCMTFLESGLLSDERSPSCRRVSRWEEIDAAGEDAETQVPIVGLPESLASDESAEGAALLQSIGRVLAAFPVDNVAELRFPALAKRLRTRSVERLGGLSVRLPLTAAYLATIPGLELPSTHTRSVGERVFEQSSIDSIIHFEVSRTYLRAWPAMTYNRQTGAVVFATSSDTNSEPIELREAHARSVSPQRLSAAQVRERREASEQAMTRAGTVEPTASRALILAHRLGVWAALRPGLCAAYELGVGQFEFAAASASIDGLNQSLVASPMFVRVVHPDRADAGVRVVEIEAREDGFLVTLTNGESQAFPFVDGDAYLKVYAFLREHAVTEVAVKSEPRVELQILSTLADAVARDRGPAESFNADRELLRAPVLDETSAVRVGLRLRCAPVTE